MEEYLISLFAGGWGLAAIVAATHAAGLVTIVLVLRQRKEPMAMLSWILGILLFPVCGTLLYFLIGERRVRRRGRKKRRRTATIVRALGSTTAHAGAVSAGWEGAIDADFLELARISTKLTHYPLTAGNRVDLFTSAQPVYDAILGAIDEARDHIHLEYYIFRPDETGCLVRDRLVARAREGIEVRLLLDGIGSWGTGRRFLRPLVEAGAKVATFLPAIPFRLPWHINARNHRKVVVVDGEVAFTGSQNIGDEYRGRLRPLGPWKDTHLKIEGPAARCLQEVFIEDWYFASREDLTGPRYLRKVGARGDSAVQIVPSGPDQESEILSHIFFAAIAQARRTARIGTPYFVPDRGLILALSNAAHRGVEVEILIPSRTDAHVVLWAGRSFYQELIRAGVRIHEYAHGMLHSKTLSIDDRWSMVGSANMDVRSFLLNFEVTAFVFDPRIARSLAEDFRHDLERSHRVPAAHDGKEPFLPSVLAGAARLLAPLL